MCIRDSDGILERQPLPETVESTQKKELKDGEHVAFVGPSGGGETAGNLPPYDGNPDAGRWMELIE